MTPRRNGRGDVPRAHTVSIRRMSKRELALGRRLYPEAVERPATRAQCESGVRPCPFVGCRHHLYLDVDPLRGSIKLNFPHLEPDELVETCALDVAERDGTTLEETALLLNLTRERVRQIEERAQRRMRAHRRLAIYGEELGR